MAAALSQRLAERYSLRLDDHWQHWFDGDAERQLLMGPFCSPIAVDDLLQAAPPDLWPGFMLPDTLPIVTNDYGDWWCARIDAHNEIAEIIQWSHGGGDWLPIGRSMAQAVLWDYVQHWRGPAIEVEQAAHEYPSRLAPGTAELLPSDDWLQWMVAAFNVEVADLQRLLGTFAQHRYGDGLELMLQHEWSTAAVACELVEIALQGQLARLADNQLALRCGINWAPEYTSWLFDTDHISAEARSMLRELAPDVGFGQDWSAAEAWAMRIEGQRGDLSWAGDVSGWAALRRGDIGRAVELFFANRTNSAFTDQSVRLRSHWFPEHLGKFSVAQLAKLQSHLSSEQRRDPYLQLLWNEPPQRTRAAVREYWLARARQTLADRNFAESYRCYMLAGWDLGAERMSDYVEILDGLATSAQQAGWSARAEIAATHAECLKRRTGQ